MREAIIVGNWKMNKNNAETQAFFEEVDPAAVSDKALYGIGAPFTDLKTALDNAKNLIVAAENVHFEDSGAFTGEVSVPMLEELGVKYCIIGHSERRQMFGDTDETVNKKAKKLLAAGMTPILCIGETEEEYDAGKTKDVITSQLNGSLADIPADEYKNIVIAYEPIWAIGTGKTATAEQAAEVCTAIRATIRNLYGARVARSITIQYGGSMNPKNAAELLAQSDVDGGLIGGAALKPDQFVEIVNAANQE